VAQARFVIYLDTASEYRWRLRAPNSEIIADSAEGYRTNAACRAGIELVRKYAPTAELVDTTLSS
jgi:uncharacterized protein YegP (UPF0339 family)